MNPSLDVHMMKQDFSISIMIEIHTDNVGKKIKTFLLRINSRIMSVKLTKDNLELTIMALLKKL